MENNEYIMDKTLKNKNIENEVSEIEEEIENDEYINNIKLILKKLFYFYSTFGNKSNHDNIKESQIIKLLIDCNFFNNQIKQNQIQIKFYKISKRKKFINFEEFLLFNNEIAQLNSKKKDQNDNFIQYLKDYIFPLYTKIYKETELGFEDTILKEKIEWGTLLIINYKINYFSNIFKKYFDIESKLKINYNEKKLLNQLKLKLINFLKDYQIIPNFIKIPTVIQFFQDIIEINDNENKFYNSFNKWDKIIDSNNDLIFSLTKFLFFLIKISIFIFSEEKNLPNNINSKNFTNDEKFYLFLEIIEVNSKFLQKTAIIKENYHYFITLSSEELINIHSETNNFPNFEQFLIKNQKEKNFMLIKLKKGKKKFERIYEKKSYEKKIGNTNKKKNITELINNKKENKVSILNSGIKIVLENYKDYLNELYIKYSKIDKNNNRFMNIENFKKMINDLNINLNSKNINVDKLFNSIIKFNNEIKNMNLLLFIKSLETISQCFYDNIEINLAFEQFINKYIINFFENKEEKYNQIKNKVNSKSLKKEIIIKDKNFFKENNKKISYGKNKIKNKENVENENKSCEANFDLNYQQNYNNFYIKCLMKCLKDKNIVNFLKKLHQIIIPFIYNYIDENNLIDFNNYYKILKDFKIFPKIIKFDKIKEIFSTLIYIYNKNPNKFDQTYKFIDCNIFIESLTIIALNLNFKLEVNLDIQNKLCFLITLMNESPLNKIKDKYKVNFVKELREEFPLFFNFENYF